MQLANWAWAHGKSCNNKCSFLVATLCGVVTSALKGGAQFEFGGTVLFNELVTKNVETLRLCTKVEMFGASNGTCAGRTQVLTSIDRFHMFHAAS